MVQGSGFRVPECSLAGVLAGRPVEHPRPLAALHEAVEGAGRPAARALGH